MTSRALMSLTVCLLMLADTQSPSEVMGGGPLGCVGELVLLNSAPQGPFATEAPGYQQ